MPDLLHTPLCTLTGIQVPIVQAPMAGGWTTPALAAAVSNAGGLGILAGARLGPAEIEAQITEVRRLTDRPFGVNFLLAPPEPPAPPSPALSAVLEEGRAALGLGLPEGGPRGPPPPVGELVELCLERRVRILSFGLGDPARFVDTVHHSGALVFAMVTTVEEARQVAEAGVDAVVAQGSEAGGHRSTFTLGPGEEPPLVGGLALVPQVVDAVRRPVIAAGGIMDGRGLLAALALGAAGAQLGTRFLLARESGVFPAYRERLLAARETDTVVTRALTGRPARALVNRVLRRLIESGVTPLPWPHQALAAEDVYRAAIQHNDAEWTPLLAGQGLRLARQVEPAGTIVEAIASEARSRAAAVCA